MENALKQIRNTSDPEKLIELKKTLEETAEQEKNIDKPDTSDLLDDPIKIHKLNKFEYVNGVGLHPGLVYIVNLVVNGKSPIIVIVGKEGNGKSYTTLKIVNELHDCGLLRGNFDPHNQTVYSPLEFGLFLRDATRKAVWFEEANETLNSNDYNSKLNNMVAGAIRTQRKRENVYLFSCPDLQELDPRIRDKADVVINMKYKRHAEFTIYEKKHDKRGNRGLDYFFDNNVPNWDVGDVDEDLAAEYEKIDDEFKGEYLDDLILKALNERIEEIQDETTATGL